jgi:prepilin-type N-terminal cleavage/methylation domain-containing protein/prepilin-type processing-associated H-X9-DG protein
MAGRASSRSAGRAAAGSTSTRPRPRHRFGRDRLGRRAPRVASPAPRTPAAARPAFTLVELLVVIGIIAVLLGLLLPALGKAQESARVAVCLTNLRSVGQAIHAYANDHRGAIPFGPKAPPFTSATDFYPSTGAATSLLSLKDGRPVGLGLLVQTYLSAQPRVLFCPAADQPDNADAELARIGVAQAQGGYYYRHGSATHMFEDPDAPVPPQAHVRLAALGRNRDGRLVRALVIDTQLIAPDGFAAFGVLPRTHHRERSAGILYADGHAAHAANTNRRFTVDMYDPAALRDAFSRILKVFERADADE